MGEHSKVNLQMPIHSETPVNDQIAQLRPTVPADLDFVQQAETAAHATGFVGQWTRDRHLQSLNDPDERHWMVVDAATQARVGYVILLGVQDPNQCLLIKRIVISQAGQGYGRSALIQVLEIAFTQLQAHRVWLDVMEDNERARSLYRSLGFVEEGRLREAAKTVTGYKSQWVMAMLRSEFLAVYRPN